MATSFEKSMWRLSPSERRNVAVLLDLDGRHLKLRHSMLPRQSLSNFAKDPVSGFMLRR